MNRIFGSFLVIALLVLQTISFVHMAEHGFEEHEHEGQICDIYLHHNQDNSADTKALTAFTETQFIEIYQADYVSIAFVKSPYNSSTPRAPPASLLN